MSTNHHHYKKEHKKSRTRQQKQQKRLMATWTTVSIATTMAGQQWKWDKVILEDLNPSPRLIVTNKLRMFLKKAIYYLKSRFRVNLKSRHIDFNVRGRIPKSDPLLQIKHNDLAKFYILIIYISISMPEYKIQVRFRK